MSYVQMLQISQKSSVNLPNGVVWTLNQIEYPNTNQIIDDYALPWLVDLTGKVMDDYTDDKELNTEISANLARAFVRRFYTREIAFENPEVFGLKLRGFLDSELPLFIKWYQELMIKNQAYVTGVSDMTVNSDGTVHVDATSTGNVTDTAHTDSNSTDNATTNATGSSDNESHDKGINTMADTPQNQINVNGMQGDDPLDGYAFDYATQVTGSNSKGESHGSSKSDTTSKGTSNSTADSTSRSDTENNSKSDQQSKNESTQHSTNRGGSIMQIANQLLGYTDGLYTELFTKMIDKGLFMMIY